MLVATNENQEDSLITNQSWPSSEILPGCSVPFERPGSGAPCLLKIPKEKKTSGNSNHKKQPSYFPSLGFFKTRLSSYHKSNVHECPPTMEKSMDL